MKHEDYVELISEKAALENLLKSVPEGDVIESASLKARLEEIDDAIADIEDLPVAPLRAQLTFNGRPVVGSHGIYAEFGLDATRIFADLVASIAASGEEPLAATGPIPDREENRLLITRTAQGSFGFELEALQDEISPEEPDALKEALQLTQDLLEGTTRSDDALADSISAVDPRAVSIARRFLQHLEGNDAICSLSLKDKTFRFSDVAEIRRGLERISTENLNEYEETLQGSFQGVLPDGRRFEFRTADGELISGKISPDIQDAETINELLGQEIQIKVNVTEVGAGRPRYSLADIIREV